VIFPLDIISLFEAYAHHCSNCLRFLVIFHLDSQLGKFLFALFLLAQEKEACGVAMFIRPVFLFNVISIERGIQDLRKFMKVHHRATPEGVCRQTWPNNWRSQSSNHHDALLPKSVTPLLLPLQHYNKGGPYEQRRSKHSTPSVRAVWGLQCSWVLTRVQASSGATEY